MARSTPPTRRPLLAAAAAALLLSVVAGTAGAAPVLFTHFSSDAAFLGYQSANGVALPADELFVAQARGGNNRSNGDHESGLHVPPDFTNAGPVGTPGQIVWGTANAAGGNPFQSFILSRSGMTITFAMGGYTDAFTAMANAALGALGFRVRSSGAGNSTEIRNVRLDGAALPGAALFAANGGLDSVVVSGLSGNFTLTGETSLNWTSESIPSGSNLGFQIKGISGFTAVSEPATVALLLTGVGGLALALRRRRRAGP